MATFVRLTRAEAGREIWLNLDHVTELCPGEGGTTLRAASGGVWVVRESPATIANECALSAHPLAGALR